MKTEREVDLAPYTTFRVHGFTPLLITVESEEELIHTLREYPNARILGGGSNILMTDHVEFPVIRIAMKGREVETSDNHVDVTLKAGENWHETVSWFIDNDWGGLENLAYIPGTVGAAPIQNIGAYGVEQKSCFVRLRAIERDSLQPITITNEQCGFEYRNSIFKHELSNTLVITSVTYRLSKPPHSVHTSYKDLAEEMSATSHLDDTTKSSVPTIRDVFDAVIRIRRRKLPDPREIGNAGSFFKNPVISMEQFRQLQSDYADVPSYPQNNETVKVPAAWLIDRSGWKGFKDAHAGVHEKQALVLVNLGDAHGSDIVNLSNKIRKSVSDKFGITLEPEVNIW